MEIARANRERALLEAEEKARMILLSNIRAEQSKLVNWAKHAVPFWLTAIPATLAHNLKLAMRMGKDLTGQPSHRERRLGAAGELVLGAGCGGLVLRFARVGPQETYVDVAHFPGVAEESFTWSYRALRDYEEFTFCAPGSTTLANERLRAMEFLDIAAAAASLPSVSAHFETLFPGFAFEMGRFEEDSSGHAYSMRVYIPGPAPVGGAPAGTKAMTISSLHQDSRRGSPRG